MVSILLAASKIHSREPVKHMHFSLHQAQSRCWLRPCQCHRASSGLFDLVLVGFDIDSEHKCSTIFYLLQGWLSSQGTRWHSSQACFFWGCSSEDIGVVLQARVSWAVRRWVMCISFYLFIFCGCDAFQYCILCLQSLYFGFSFRRVRASLFAFGAFFVKSPT